MSLLAQLQSGIGTIGLLVGAMAILAVIEAAIPLHARGRWHRAHLGPNLALTFMTFATNLFLNAALVLSLIWLQSNNVGLLSKMHFAPLVTLAIVVLVLDFSF